MRDGDLQLSQGQQSPLDLEEASGSYYDSDQTANDGYLYPTRHSLFKMNDDVVFIDDTLSDSEDDVFNEVEAK